MPASEAATRSLTVPERTLEFQLRLLDEREGREPVPFYDRTDDLAMLRYDEAVFVEGKSITGDQRSLRRVRYRRHALSRADYVRSGFDAVGIWAEAWLGLPGFACLCIEAHESGSRGHAFNTALEGSGKAAAPELLGGEAPDEKDMGSSILKLAHQARVRLTVQQSRIDADGQHTGIDEAGFSQLGGVELRVADRVIEMSGRSPRRTARLLSTVWHGRADKVRRNGGRDIG